MKFQCEAKELWAAMSKVSRLTAHRVGSATVAVIATEGSLFVQDWDYRVTARCVVAGGVAEKEGVAVIGTINSPIQYLSGDVAGKVSGKNLVLNETKLRLASNQFDTIETLNEPFVVVGDEIFIPPRVKDTTWMTNTSLPYRECLFIAPQVIGCLDGYCVAWINANTAIKKTVAVMAAQLPELAEAHIFASEQYVWIISPTLAYRTCVVEVPDMLSKTVHSMEERELVFETPLTHEFSLALQRLEALTRTPYGGGGLAAMDIEPGRLFLESGPSETGYDSSEFPIEWEGEKRSLSFRPGQLVKMSKFVNEGATLQIRHSEEPGPADGPPLIIDVLIVTDGEVAHASMACASEWREKERISE